MTEVTPPYVSFYTAYCPVCGKDLNLVHLTTTGGHFSRGFNTMAGQDHVLVRRCTECDDRFEHQFTPNQGGKAGHYGPWKEGYGLAIAASTYGEFPASFITTVIDNKGQQYKPQGVTTEPLINQSPEVVVFWPKSQAFTSPERYSDTPKCGIVLDWRSTEDWDLFSCELDCQGTSFKSFLLEKGLSKASMDLLLRSRIEYKEAIVRLGGKFLEDPNPNTFRWVMVGLGWVEMVYEQEVWSPK